MKINSMIKLPKIAMILLRASLLLLLTLFLTASEAHYTTQAPFATAHNLSNSFKGATSVITADIDQDGDLDVLAAAWEDHDITWWENASSWNSNPGTSFTEHPIDTHFRGAHSVMVSDIDNDGDIDVLGAADLDNQITWWENTEGNGSTWTQHTVDDNFDGARSVYAVDLDRDGDQDILGAALRGRNISWWENSEGNGSTWVEHSVSTNFAFAESVHAGDMDSDGDLDILGASWQSDSVTWWENSAGNASIWNEHTINSEFTGARSALAVDMDKDGDLDVLGAAIGRPDISGGNEIAWWENSIGNASTWIKHSVDASFLGAISATATDIDMDGDLDVLGAGYGADDITWWENSTGDSQNWSQHTIEGNFDDARSVYPADMDNDGDLDVLGAAFTDASITWWENESIRRTASFYDTLQNLDNLDSEAVALGDIDSDGDLDAFVANNDQPNTVWSNDGTGTFSFVQGIGNSKSTDVALADFDHDGDLDAFVTNTGAQANKIWLNNGSGSFIDSGQNLGNEESSSIALGDLDRDGDLDAFVANKGQSNKVWLNDGNGRFTDNGQILGNSNSLGVALGDLDRDGDLDAFVTNVNAQTNKVWLNDGSALFTASRQGLDSTYSYDVGLGDLDHDGDLDAFIANGGVDSARLNNGDGTFADNNYHLGGGNSRSVTLADVDKDGDLDAFVTHPYTQINIVWLNNGDGTFSSGGPILATSSSKDAALGDLDHDGDLDAFVINDEGNQIWKNGTGQVALDVTDTAPDTIDVRTPDDMLRIVVTHNGVEGDHDIELATFALKFEDVLGTPLTTAQANALIENLQIYLNNGSSNGFDNGDTLVKTIDTLTLSSGEQTVSFADGDTNVQIVWGTPRTYLVVVELTTNAHVQTPNSFRVTHLNTNSIVEDRHFDIPLRLQYTADVPSSMTKAIGPPIPTIIASNTPINAPTNTPSNTATQTPINTPSPTSTSIVVATNTATQTPANTPLPTSTSTATAIAMQTETPTPAGTGDAYESDDTCAQASSIATDGSIQAHTFHAQNDRDWVAFDVTAGVEYAIQARVPSGSSADVILEVYGACDTVVDPGQDPSFSPDVRLKFKAPTTGTYHLHLLNHDPNEYGSDVTYSVSIRALDSTINPGALVVVAGRLYSDDERDLQANIQHVTNKVYRLFRAKNYPPERIRYLATDLNIDATGDTISDVSALASKAQLQHTITQWTADKELGPERAFTLYLMDHGGENGIFYLDNPRGERVTAQELDEWITQLETNNPGVKVNIIIEACYSGSFVNRLTGSGNLSNDRNELLRVLGAPNRVLITSTDSVALAYASPQGAWFSDSLLDALSQDMSLAEAFEEATRSVLQANPAQLPLLEANGDGIPNRIEDYKVAAQRGFAIPGSFTDDKWPPYIKKAELRHIKNGQAEIWAEVEDDQKVANVWAVIQPPFYQPISQEGELVSSLLPENLFARGNNQYGVLSSSFDEQGTYRVIVYAEDAQGLISRPKELILQTGSQLYLPLIIR